MKVTKAVSGLLFFSILASFVPRPARAEMTAEEKEQIRQEVRDEVKKEVEQQTKSTSADETAQPKESKKVDFTSGKGITIAESPNGEMRITGYMLVRYINQLPPGQTFQDHLGNTRSINASNYISAPHRVLLSVLGWAYDPRFNYCTTFWTVNATDKTAIIGYLSWTFSKRMTLFAGVGSLPGIRSLTYNHPYWLGTDRPMAEEFFRPGFTQGVWAQGEALPGVNYDVMIGNNLTTLNVNQTEDSRDFAYSGNVWWMPTTHEFGPKGGTGDFEDHQKLATRFGTGYTQGRQNAAVSTGGSNMPDSTQIRMADSLLPFSAGALVPGITVDKLKYQLWSADAAYKYKGFWLQVQGYIRRLSDYVQADGAAVDFPTIVDKGGDLQLSKMIQPKKTELYLATSYIVADKSGNYKDSHEFIQGINRYLWGSHNSRLNLHVIEVYRSPAQSVFGYYTGGLRGVIVSAGWSVNF